MTSAAMTVERVCARRKANSDRPAAAAHSCPAICARSSAEHARERRAQRRQVHGQQQQPERQHPDPEHRQDREHAAEGQQHGGRNAHHARLRLAPVAGTTRAGSRQPRLKPFDQCVEIRQMRAHGVRNIGSRWAKRSGFAAKSRGLVRACRPLGQRLNTPLTQPLGTTSGLAGGKRACGMIRT